MPFDAGAKDWLASRHVWLESEDDCSWEEADVRVCRYEADGDDGSQVGLGGAQSVKE